MPADRAVRFDVIEQCEGQLKTQGAWVFNDEQEWKAGAANFENELIVTPWPEIPTGIDWKNHGVILVSAGQSPSGPSGVAIKSISQSGNRAELDVELQQAGLTQSLTAPWIIVKVHAKNIKTVTPHWRTV